MYLIENAHYGYRLTFSGLIGEAEMLAWLNESRRILAEVMPAFGVFVDMRELQPLAPDAQVYMEEGQRLYKQRGMRRSVVILSGALTTLQFRRIAKDTGIDAWERYIDASLCPDFEDLGVAWITEGIDP